MSDDQIFTHELFDFLFDLDVHNDRAWFDANRGRYEEHVRGPLLRFVSAFEEPLRAISPHFVADPRKVGGSVFRIHRDTRFSKDKRPYKSNAGAQFRHEYGRDVHAPGFYLHLEPGNSFAGGGMWRPPTATLTAIRQAIVDKPGAWTRARNQLADRGLEVRGERLKTAPRGFDRDHPHIGDLRLTSFTVMAPFDEDDVTAPDVVDRYAARCEAAMPLFRFLCRALDLPF